MGMATVVVGDNNGHVGLGVKCSKEVANAIRAAIILAKLSVIPIRRGYWGTKLGEPHTFHAKCTPSADPSICDSSQLHEVPVSLPLQYQRRSSPTPDTPMFTLLLKVAPPPSVTLLKLPSRLLLKPQAT